MIEFPYAPEGGVKRIEGRPALIDYLAGLGNLLTIDSMTTPIVYRTINTDPTKNGAQTVILEFDGVARSLATGSVYQQNYISVIKLAGGHIVHYRDYWNPLVVIRLMDDAEAADQSSGEKNNDR